jgi:hypothetical protein
MGARSHHYILKHLDVLEGSIIEIGCGRGEGSTDFYAGLVVGITKFKHHAVDFDIQPYTVAKTYADQIPNSFAYNMTGEEFLQTVFPQLQEKICYAYLDNFDFDYSPENPMPWIAEQKKRYAEYNLTMNNQNSKLAHLNQTKALLPFCADKCIIHLDDTWYTGVEWEGKGGTAVPYLLEHKWQIVYTYTNTVALANFER